MDESYTEAHGDYDVKSLINNMNELFNIDIDAIGESRILYIKLFITRLYARTHIFP